MNKDEEYMQMALSEARTAFDKGEIPVGAVMVEDNEVIVSSHNTKEMISDPTAHAELNVIRASTKKKGDWRLANATLYVTKEPCVMCAGAIVNARIGRLVYGCRDVKYGAIDSHFQIVYYPGLNHKVSVRSGILKEECAEILKRFFKLRR